MLNPAAAFAFWLRAAPTPLHERLLVLTVNQLLRGQAFAERLEELDGKRFQLRVEDVPIALTFEISGRALVRSACAPDVTLRGALADFIALATRSEDPDTLFFQRRLAVEGETETGLHLKNLLDSWEYDVPSHVRDVLPAPLAGAALAVKSGVQAFHELIRLRLTSSRHNTRREGGFQETPPASVSRRSYL
nr:SCP2 sterol-binding domain-containing protein [Steroidobacter denitrificans]